jgi:dipeptidase E
MKVLLGSGGLRSEERRELCRNEMRTHFGDIDRILFVPWAVVDHDWYVQRIVESGLNAGYEIDGIHTHADPVKAIEDAQGIYVGGGNTFLLTRQLHRTSVMATIRRRVLEDGLPYMGVSAGSNVACPTMQTTNDMPVVFPGSFETLGLVPFQVNAHYYAGAIWIREDDEYQQHFGETREDRIREFHQHNAAPVIGLCEGAFFRCDGETVQLVGGKATLFQAGKDPLIVTANFNPSNLLNLIHHS